MKKKKVLKELMEMKRELLPTKAYGNKKAFRKELKDRDSGEFEIQTFEQVVDEQKFPKKAADTFKDLKKFLSRQK